MIFVKFYEKFYTDRANHELQASLRYAEDRELNESEAFKLSKRVFGEGEHLVDMNSLVEYLVQSIGTGKIIDPLTKEDSIWSLIDFFTSDKDFVQISSMSENNHISGRVIAEYLGNQLENTSAFERLFKVALRLDRTTLSGEFFPELMHQLKEYQSKSQGQLPMSFTEKVMKDFYLKLRASKVDLSTDMSELLLFILSQNDMHYEVIDFCEHQKKLGLQSDIHSYYLSESLFKLELNDGTYLEALEGSEMFHQTSDDTSACQLTQKTKAMFLDKGAEEAIKYFKEKLSAREQRSQDRQDLLVTLYN